jgi:hypothetical protein
MTDMATGTGHDDLVATISDAPAYLISLVPKKSSSGAGWGQGVSDRAIYAGHRCAGQPVPKPCAAGSNPAGGTHLIKENPG